MESSQRMARMKVQIITITRAAPWSVEVPPAILTIRTLLADDRQSVDDLAHRLT